MSEIGGQYAKIVEARKYSVLLLSYFLGGIFLSAFAAWQLHHLAILWIGFIIFGICPIIFKKYYKRPFIKKVSVECTNSYFDINVFDSKKDEVMSVHKYFYNDIKSYRTFESTTESSSQLKIWLREGGSVNYIFVEEKYDEGDSILNIIMKEIKAYSLDKENHLPYFFNHLTKLPAQLKILISDKKYTFNYSLCFYVTKTKFGVKK